MFLPIMIALMTTVAVSEDRALPVRTGGVGALEGSPKVNPDRPPHVKIEDPRSSQDMNISQEEMDLLQQLELLETWDILKSSDMDEEMKEQEK